LRHPDNAEFLDFDDNNETHLAVHAVSAVELLQVFMDEPLWAQNKKGRTGVWLMVGRTHGGRPLVAAVIFDENRNCVRPITARTCTEAEVAKWRV
jgi:uncharacterized DUF497 family protein